MNRIEQLGHVNSRERNGIPLTVASCRAKAERTWSDLFIEAIPISAGNLMFGASRKENELLGLP